MQYYEPPYQSSNFVLSFDPWATRLKPTRSMILAHVRYAYSCLDCRGLFKCFEERVTSFDIVHSTLHGVSRVFAKITCGSIYRTRSLCNSKLWIAVKIRCIVKSRWSHFIGVEDKRCLLVWMMRKDSCFHRFESISSAITSRVTRRIKLQDIGVVRASRRFSRISLKKCHCVPYGNLPVTFWLQ